ncbi:methionine--tRNA ligase [Haliangium ochraceum]|uniref:Methionine--tRNA ligase n=1 Tax=Haliangium ochraceum (strain DSM 14365 / JCM 11303 / SMP-2) TaxID=502025 RepID=D0LY31_HALO1|nr:methionine--tRNA ligase [Haliangium ochraceum]ACY14386.1 methionyl-tRNA synthetase [Haliangium ochraceum DSM 14365]
MKTLITAGLPYINGIKHLGNLVGSMLPADVYARFLRQEGDEVLYVCATDEHGVPAELAAHEAGQPVEAFCEAQHQIQADIYRRFGIAFDYFGRSSAPSNHELTREIFSQLADNGFIEKRATQQVYSLDDQRYLPDRYVIGTCPRCGYEAARGDQCESCTTLLDPTDLIEPRSAVSGSTKLEVRSTEHLYLLLSKLEPTVKDWVEEQGQWPPLTRQVAGKWLGEGLRDRCITRNLAWGVDVPGEEELVFYVWFDAPIGYIAATRDWAESSGQPDAWKAYWQDATDVHYVQFMGKDNLPFHTIMFPAMLMGASSSWNLPDQIKGLHWLNYYGGKFSTSQKRGVFSDAALELFPADYWRYALMAQIPETSDSTFTWEMFASAVNKDLASVLGNFVNRVLRFTRSKFGETLPEGGSPGPAEAALQEECEAQVKLFRASMRALEFRRAMQALRKLWTIGNTYIDTEAPWAAIKTDRDRAAVVIRTCFNLLRLYGVSAQPIMPTLSASVLDALQLSDAERSGHAGEHVDLSLLGPGRPFEAIPPLVTQIDDDRLEELKQRFGC